MVMRADGVAWVNMGDSYATGAGKVVNHPGGGKQGTGWRGTRGGHEGKHGYSEDQRGTGAITQPNRLPIDGLKPKDLCGMPWRLAFALQADGWYLRQDIIWAKPNPMPESVTDRCTKSHEYIFLLSKSERYYYDARAIQEPFTESSIARLAQPNLEQQAGSDRAPGKTNGPMKACGPSSYRGSTFTKGKSAAVKPTVSQGERTEAEGRNKRSVWSVATQPFKEAHFATFPPALIEPCILAGCPPGGTVLDPFFGAGTTGLVSDRLQRHCIGIELNANYIDMARKRINGETPLFAAAE